MASVPSTGSASVMQSITTGSIRLPAIHVEGLNHQFGSGENGTPVLSDVNLDIGYGEVVVLTGPSGSGKTTLLTLIGALRQVQHGSMRVLSRGLEGLAPADLVALRRQIGFIFQHHNLFSSLSAIENVRMATALQGGKASELNQRSVELLTRMGLGDRLHNLPARLSGGQRQRVAIARALVHQPRLILADEPTASLDARTGQDVLTILHQMAQGPSRSTVLIVTHDQRVLDRADRIVNLVAGRIVSNVYTQLSIRICKSLHRVKELQDLSAPSLARLADSMTVEIYPPGAMVVAQGRPGTAYYVVSHGNAEQLESGQREALLTENAIFGHISEIDAQPAPRSVRALTELEVFVLNQQALDRVLTADRSLDNEVREHLMARQ